jgi:hypothetical protein
MQLIRWLQNDDCLLVGDSIMTDLSCPHSSSSMSPRIPPPTATRHKRTEDEKRNFGDAKRNYFKLLEHLVENEDIMERIEIVQGANGKGAIVSIRDTIAEKEVKINGFFVEIFQRIE